MNGKYTDWGMTYQKLVLMYCFMKLSNSYDSFHYEGEDDVVCINSLDNRKYLIQAKTGKMTDEEKKNVIYNWIKLAPTGNVAFSIFSVKGHRFELESMRGDILNSIESASSEPDSSNIKQAYIACTTRGLYDRNKANEYFDLIKTNFEYQNKATDDVLFNEIFNYYKANKIHDDKYVDSQIQKHIDLIVEKYLKFLYDNSKYSANSNTPIVISANQVDQWIDIAKNTYGISGYNARYIDIKENFSPTIIDSKREVSQMKELGLQDNLIIGFLIDEEFYKDFRHFYMSNDSRDIDALEAKAFDNYETASIGNDFNNRNACLNLFKSVIEKIIDDPLIKNMTDSQYCSKGCYLYLTSDNAGADIQITWINQNE